MGETEAADAWQGGAVVLRAATMSQHAPPGQAQSPASGLPARVAALEATVANPQSQLSALQQEAQFVSVTSTEMYSAVNRDSHSAHSARKFATSPHYRSRVVSVHQRPNHG